MLTRPPGRPPSAYATMAMVACVLAAAACGKKGAPAAEGPEVLVVDVAQRDVPIYGEWVGTIDGNINAQIRAKVQGYLRSRPYQEGSLVKTGDVLFELAPRQYQAALDQAKGDLARAQADLVRSQQNVARYRPLVEKGAVSRKELDDTIQQMRADTATVEGAQAALENAQLNLHWTTVRSPIDGIAGIAPTQIGDLIAPSTLMTTVSQVDPIKVYFPISEREYLRFAERGRRLRQQVATYVASFFVNRPIVAMVIAIVGGGWNLDDPQWVAVSPAAPGRDPTSVTAPPAQAAVP